MNRLYIDSLLCKNDLLFLFYDTEPFKTEEEGYFSTLDYILLTAVAAAAGYYFLFKVSPRFLDGFIERVFAYLMLMVYDEILVVVINH